MRSEVIDDAGVGGFVLQKEFARAVHSGQPRGGTDSCRYPRTICFARCTTAQYCQHLIDYTEPSVESWLNGIAAIDCDKSVQDLPQDLGMGNQRLTDGDRIPWQTNGLPAAASCNQI